MLAIAAFGCSVISPLAPRLVSFESRAPARRQLFDAARSAEVRCGKRRIMPVSARESASSATPRITNAVFHPDEFPAVRSVANDSKRTSLALRKSSVHRQKTVTATLPVSGTEFEPRAVREEVILVVQRRFYDMSGQSMLTYSVYRFVSFAPGTAPEINPKKI